MRIPVPTIKKLGLNIFTSVVGNEFAYRFGRAMYLHARRESSNDMTEDGELALACHLASRAKDLGFGNILFDVGANCGDWTKAVLKNAPTNAAISVHCFEPVSSTRAILAQGVRQWSDRVQIVAAAASDRCGEAEIFVVSEGAGRNSLYDFTGLHATKEKVQLTTIDEYCRANGVAQVLLVKCDTEGNDLNVLRGAANVLRDGRIGCFQFEYGPPWIDSQSRLKEVFSLISEMPYSLGRLTPTHIEFIEAWHPELERYFLANFVLVHERIKGQLPCSLGRFDSSNVYVQTTKRRAAFDGTFRQRFRRIR